jgi:hypothetical protein
VVTIQAQRASPQLSRHGSIAIVFRDTEVNPSREQRREKNKTLRGTHETKRLIYPRTGSRGQMRQSDPDKHHSPHRIKF